MCGLVIELITYCSAKVWRSIKWSLKYAKNFHVSETTGLPVHVKHFVHCWVWLFIPKETVHLKNEVISVSSGYLTTLMPHYGMNAHHWRYTEWQLKPRTELQIQLHKSCYMTVKSTASCQFLFLTWHVTDSKWMPKGLRQFSTLSLQDVFKTDVRSAEYFLPVGWSLGKNCVSEGKEKNTVLLIH